MYEVAKSFKSLNKIFFNYIKVTKLTIFYFNIQFYQQIEFHVYKKKLMIIYHLNFWFFTKTTHQEHCINFQVLAIKIENFYISDNKII